MKAVSDDGIVIFVIVIIHIIILLYSSWMVLDGSVIVGATVLTVRPGAG